MAKCIKSSLIYTLTVMCYTYQAVFKRFEETTQRVKSNASGLALCEGKKKKTSVGNEMYMTWMCQWKLQTREPGARIALRSSPSRISHACGHRSPEQISRVWSALWRPGLNTGGNLRDLTYISQLTNGRIWELPNATNCVLSTLPPAADTELADTSYILVLTWSQVRKDLITNKSLIRT